MSLCGIVTGRCRIGRGWLTSSLYVYPRDARRYASRVALALSSRWTVRS